MLSQLVVVMEFSKKIRGGKVMKVLIVGAGGQGGSCASILARQDMIDEIRLVDLKEETAKKLQIISEAAR